MALETTWTCFVIWPKMQLARFDVVCPFPMPDSKVGLCKRLIV